MEAALVMPRSTNAATLLQSRPEGFRQTHSTYAAKAYLTFHPSTNRLRRFP